MSDCCGGTGFPSAVWPTLASIIPPWLTPTLINSWVNFGGGEQDLQYRKVDDMVQIRGVVKSGAIGSVIAVLPVGYRPPSPLGFGVSSAGALGTLVVQPSGNLLTTNGSNTSFHANVMYSVTP